MLQDYENKIKQSWSELNLNQKFVVLYNWQREGKTMSYPVFPASSYYLGLIENISKIRQ